MPKVRQKLVDAVAGAAMPFHLAVPAAFGGVVSEGLLDLTSSPQPRGVLGCGDELGAGQVEVAFAWAFGGEAQAPAEFELFEPASPIAT
ncbi:hypothetical protein ACWD9K_30360 [Streptomyces sp. 900116325]